MAKLVFALHESGRVLHVGDVSSGLACRCACLDCGEAMVARKGEVREHHFGHTSGKEHDWAWETHLHAYAKQLIVDAGGLAVPLHETVARHLGLPADHRGAHIKAAGAPVLKEISRGAIRPDLILRLAEGEIEIALEVRVTHGCDQVKRAEYDRQRLAALEIDLRSFSPERFDPKKLRDAVLNQMEHKTWLWPLAPRPSRARLVSVDGPALAEEAWQLAAQPQLPRKPLPPPFAVQFRVSAWRAAVTVAVHHEGEEHICVRVMDMAIGRMASTNAEQAAPRIAELVGFVVTGHSEHAANPRAGTWVVPSWEAAAVAAALQDAALRYPVIDDEKHQAQAVALQRDLQDRRQEGWSRQSTKPFPQEPHKGPGDSPYARRRG